MNREEAIKAVNEVLNGSGVWASSYPKQMAGTAADFSDPVFTLGMEYGVIHGLMRAFKLSRKDLGQGDDDRVLDWETGNWVTETTSESTIKEHQQLVRMLVIKHMRDKQFETSQARTSYKSNLQGLAEEWIEEQHLKGRLDSVENVGGYINVGIRNLFEDYWNHTC